MKLRHLHPATLAICEHLIAQFGKGRLVQNPGGKLVLKGGTKADRIEAQEFVSLFMHEAVLSFAE
jgi:hypothetical protein